MTRLFVPGILLSALLAGCASVPDSSEAFAQFSPGAPLMHRSSHFLFPSQVGNFHRTRELVYSMSGDDVLVGYDDRQVPVSATVYVYPAHGRRLPVEFASRQAELCKDRMGAQLLAAQSVVVTPDRTSAMWATYQIQAGFSGSFQPLRADLLVGQAGNYFVEYRFTYPVSLLDTAPAEIWSFEQTLTWPYGG